MDIASLAGLTQAIAEGVSNSMDLRMDKFQDSMDQKMDKFQNNLTSFNVTQTDKLGGTLKTGMDDILSCLIKRQDVYEAQSENRFNNLEDAIVKKQSENEKKTETRFSGIEKQLSALSSAINKKTSQFPQLPSPTFAPLSLASRSQPPHPTSLPQPTFPGVQLPNQQPNLNQVDQAAIANIVSNARTIIGIGPISPAEIEDTGGNTPEDKLFIAAVDYLRKEIGVKNSEIEDADITEVFPAEDPSLQQIYVKFSSREQAELCLHLTRRLKKPELNVVLFIPSQFKQRFNALRNEDYRLRRLTNPLHKTRIEFSVVCSPYPVNSTALTKICSQGMGW